LLWGGRPPKKREEEGKGPRGGGCFKKEGGSKRGKRKGKTLMRGNHGGDVHWSPPLKPRGWRVVVKGRGEGEGIRTGGLARHLHAKKGSE